MPVIKKVNSKGKGKQYTNAEKLQGPIINNRVLSLYDAIVGSGAQVASGAATHTSLQAAHDYVSSGGTILVLKGSFVGATIINKKVQIIGQGNNSNLAADVTLAAGSSFSVLKYLRFNNNLTINIGSDGSFITDCWIAGGGGSVLTDNGSANYKTIVSEI